jgi:imidazolonepropionase-like amidohydrolase
VSFSIRASEAWLGPGRHLEDARAVIDAGQVVAAGPATGVEPGEQEIVLDGFLMPAVADRHVHVELSDPASVLLRGVTAVRDLGWPADRIFPLADASEMPSFNGPLIRAAGPMLTAPGGYPSKARWAPAGTALEVEDVEEAAWAAKDLVSRGATAVKIALDSDAGPTLSDAQLMAICDTAHEAELPVTAHAQGEGQVGRALGAGVDELAHTPWTHRLSDDLIAAAAQRLRIVSTLDICSFGRDTREVRTALDNLHRFHQAGGKVLYGTDLGNGDIPPGIHAGEAILMAQAGLEYEEVLEAMIRAPLEPGAPADLMVVSESPLDRLDAFNELLLVMRAGNLVLQP